MIHKNLFFLFILLLGDKIAYGMDLQSSNKLTWSGKPYAQVFEKQPKIFEAIYEDNLEKVKKIIEKISTKNQLEIRNDLGTPLLWAVRKNRIAIVEYLLSKGANVNASTSGFDILYLATSFEMLTLLLSSGVSNDKFKKNALGKWLSDLNIYTSETNRFSRCMKCALVLIQYGARLDRYNIIGLIDNKNAPYSKQLLFSALLFAFENNNNEYANNLVKICKKNHIILDDLYDDEGKTLLYYQALRKPSLVSDVLIKLYPSLQGLYASLVYAFERNDKEYVQSLIKICKINNILLDEAIDNKQNTLLHYLITSEPKALRNAKAKLLLETFPLLIDKQDSKKATALYYAMKVFNDNAMVSLLVRFGADVTLGTDKPNIIPFDFALNNVRFMRTLLNKGMNEFIPKTNDFKNEDECSLQLDKLSLQDRF